MVQKDWFVCDNLLLDTNLTNLETPYADCTTLERNFESFDSGKYFECTSNMECPFVSDTGINIEISGNSPIPSSILALIDTQENIGIGIGDYNVTESLSTESQSLFTDFVGNILTGIAYDPVNERMYVTNSGDGSVSVISTETNTVIGDTIAVGSNPQRIAYDPVNERMYVTNSGDGSVSVISTETNTVIDTINVGNMPIA